MKLTPDRVIKRWQSLDSDRSNWMNHWQDVTDYVTPEKNEVIVKREVGAKRNTHLFDTTAQHSLELLAAALHTMLTNPHSQWVEFFTGDEAIDNRDDVRLWLQKAARDFHQTLNKSNFRQSIHEFYMDLGSIGTAIMAIEEDDEDVVRFTPHPIRGSKIDENHKCMIDEIYRDFEWDAKKIVGEFGKESLPKFILDAFANGDSKKFNIIHAAYPSDIGTEEDTRANMKFTSQWVLEQDKHELRVGGFKQFPFIVSRWMKTTGEIYGRSPSMTALPDIKMINMMSRTVIQGAQKTD